MNIVECTVKMKKETQAHYERLSEVVSNDELRRLFSLFAAAEGEHVERLIVLENNLKSMHARNMEGLAESVCVHSPHLDFVHVAEALKNDADGCRYAEQEEKETIEFFDALSNQAENEELKRVCHLLADKEREHLKMLEEIYFFVEEPKTYLEWGEFSNLKSL